MSDSGDSDKSVGRPPETREEILAACRRLGVVTAKGLAGVLGWDRKQVNRQLRRYGMAGYLREPEGAPQAWVPARDAEGQEVRLLLVTREEAEALGRSGEWTP